MIADEINPKEDNRPPAIRAGTKVLCSNGHYVCTCTKDVHLGDVDWRNSFGGFKHGTPERIDVSWYICKECGADIPEWARPSSLHPSGGQFYGPSMAHLLDGSELLEQKRKAGLALYLGHEPSPEECAEAFGGISLTSTSHEDLEIGVWETDCAADILDIRKHAITIAVEVNPKCALRYLDDLLSDAEKIEAWLGRPLKPKSG